MDKILIREILEFINKNRRSDGRHIAPCLSHYTDDEIQYHARLCVEAGLFTKLQGPTVIYPIELTLAGQRKLQDMRDTDPSKCSL